MRRRALEVAVTALVLAGCAPSASDQARNAFSIPAATPVDTVVLRDAVRRALPPGTPWNDVVSFMLEKRIAGASSDGPASMTILLADPAHTFAVGLRFDPQRRVSDVSVSDWSGRD